MRLTSKMAFAALLLGSGFVTAAVAASPYTGCPAGFHRKADSEAGGVSSVNLNTRKADSEAGGVSSVNLNTRKADSEAGGVSSVNLNTRRAEAIADLPCVQ